MNPEDDGDRVGPAPRETDTYTWPDRGLTATSLICTWLALVPSMPAILPARSLTWTECFSDAVARSPVSMANSAAPFVSPTNRMPSGPNVNGPADLRSGFPCLRLAVGSAATAIAAVNAIPASAMTAPRIPILDIAGSPSLLNLSIPN